MESSIRTLWRQHLFSRFTFLHLSGLALLAAGAFANFRYGVSLGSNDLERIIAGAASVGADIFNAVGLVAAAWCFQNRKYIQGTAACALLILTICYSLNAALGFAAATMDATLAERQAQVTSQARLASERAALSKLADVRPVETLEAEMRGILANPKAEGCKSLNGPYTREHCPKYFALKAELGRAREKRVHQMTIKDIEAKTGQQTAQQTYVGDADPAAVRIRRYLRHMGADVSERDINVYMSLMFPLLVVLGGPIAIWIAEERLGVRKPQPLAAIPLKKAPEKPVQADNDPGEGDGTPEISAPVAASLTAQKRRSKVYQLSPVATKVLNRIMAQGGEVNATSKNALANAIKIPRSSMTRAIEALENAGQITVDSSSGLRLIAA